jgi:hypothetical protein
VTFNLYDNPNGTGTPLFTDTESLVNGVATSAGYTATATGTDYWVATYNGDSNNSPVSSGNGDEPVTIIDNDLALGSLPADITVNATNPAGAQVTYTPPTASDEGGETPSVNCDHASGSTFPIGKTTVTCTTSDADDANSPVSGSFTVTVRDTDLGMANVPGTVAATATGKSGAAVTYTPPTVVDEDSPASATVNCLPASGSTFPIGTTTVTCTVSDTEDLNTPPTVSFTVAVISQSGDLPCTGSIAGINIPHDLTVPSGATCSLGPATTVTHDTKVQKGGSLNTNGASFGHDLNEDGPNGGTVCASSISHDLSVRNSTGTITICTNKVGHDLNVQNNSGPVSVTANTVTHDLTVQNNTPGGATVSGNSAGHDANCQANTPQAGSGNSAGHNNSCPI